MSNLEREPSEWTCGEHPGRVSGLDGAENAAGADQAGELLDAREVPLGGPRAMRVRRSLPQRRRSLIGAWCFVDHYGPDDVGAGGGMRVAGHPHTGLQTVSWLFDGEVEHRDTVGSHAMVLPGEVNLMTAGAGIAHSEYSTPGTTVLHGAQLWVALPEPHRHTAPGFAYYRPPVLHHDGATLRVFLGDLLGAHSPVPTFTPLLGAEITLPARATLRLPVDPAFEHGALVDTGVLTAAGITGKPGQLVYRPPGADALTLAAGDGPVRLLLLGGPPFGEQIVMWWNFVARSHDEIAGYRERWQAERAGTATGSPRFGPFPEQWAETLPAPALPNIRLKPHG